jgi:lactate dehydrogenase-like 2-hydroxyacid dehydrogenase
MKYKIAVLDNIRLLPDAQEQLKEIAVDSLVFPDDSEVSESELFKRTSNAQAILISTDPWIHIGESYLDACPTVRYVGVCGTSTANVDLEVCKDRGVTVTNVKDYGDEPTAEFIFMRLTELTRGIGEYQWKDMPHELMDKSIGIIGLGALGKSIAHLALAYKMHANYFSPHRKPDWEKKGLHYLELPELLKTCEIIVISTPTNVQALGEKEFALIQPNSILVQASIGTPINQNAFFDWIKKEGNFAIFDYGVGEQNYQRYKELPRVIISKTTSGYSSETRQRLGQKVIENLKNYFEK